MAVIDSTICKAHSIRGASTTAASNAGVTTHDFCHDDILNAADWGTPSFSKSSITKPSINTPIWDSCTMEAELETHIDM